MPEEGTVWLEKVNLIQRWLSDWHAVLWLDADCIVPSTWSLPSYRAGCQYFFPWLKSEVHGRTAHTFASLWFNCSESFNLLNRMRALGMQADNCQNFGTLLHQYPRPRDRQALNAALKERLERQDLAGMLDRGLVHFTGSERWEKEAKLKLHTVA